MPNADNLAEFAALTEQKRSLETGLRDVKLRIVLVEESLLEQFTSEGVKSIKLADGELIYAQSSTYVGGDTALLQSLFSDNGLIDLCTINHSKVSAWYREHEKAGTLDAIPANVLGALVVRKELSLRMRSG